MPQINFLISNHKLPPIMESIARAFAPKQSEKDNWRVEQIKLAMNWIQSAVVESRRRSGTCNEAFEALPGGKKFSDLWVDQSIFISFHTSPDPTLYGQAVKSGKDLAVAYGSFKQGWKMVAATLIHELAHLNGAPGDTSEAEDTLLRCGLKRKHQDDIIGYMKAIPKNAIRFA